MLLAETAEAYASDLVLLTSGSNARFAQLSDQPGVSLAVVRRVHLGQAARVKQ